MHTDFVARAHSHRLVTVKGWRKDRKHTVKTHYSLKINTGDCQVFLHLEALADYVKNLKKGKGALLDLQKMVYLAHETVWKNVWKQFWEVALK